jgi:sec-independent protein translocase protein TatC
MSPASVSRLRTRKDRPKPDAMTLAEHLGELRNRLIISVVAIVVGATIATVFYTPILNFLLHPLCSVNRSTDINQFHITRSDCNLYVTSPLDGLSLRVKISVFGGLVLASPVILWEIWRFITPGLKAREKRYAVPFVVMAVFLFVLGCATAYWILPHALGFLQAVGGHQLVEIYNPNQYLGLILIMMALFGITFEFPVVLVSLELAGIVSPAALLRAWRWAVIAIFAVAAIFTPSSDPFSMLALALPLTVFYFAAIGIGKLLGR